MSFLEEMAAAERSAERAESQRKRCAGGRPKTNGTGYRANNKLLCSSCGFIARASRGALERCGVPLCGCGAGPLELVSELEAAERDGRETHELERWEAGAIERASRAKRLSGASDKRCAASGCNKFALLRYCPAHESERPEMGAAYKGRG